uniref:Putative ovule protein n=1 Tax=Solanum chacoense TaxID=4108 RepID=A0A0V0GKY6_SOLCH
MGFAFEILCDLVYLFLFSSFYSFWIYFIEYWHRFCYEFNSKFNRTVSTTQSMFWDDFRLC